MKKLSLLIAALALVVACKKHEKPAASDKPVADKLDKPDKPAEPPPPPKLTAPWGDPAATASKLAGAWIVKDFGHVGSLEAWNIQGTDVTIYDPKDKSEKKDKLAFTTPCDVRLQDAGWGGTLVIDGSTAYLGLGSGGWKEGDTLLACAGSGTYYLKGTECTLWRHKMGTMDELETQPATCSVADDGLHMKTSEEETSLRFFNDHILLTDQLAANKIEKQADWASAKAKVDLVYTKNMEGK